MRTTDLLTWFKANADRIRAGFEGKRFTDEVAVLAFPAGVTPAYGDEYEPNGQMDLIQVSFNTLTKRYVKVSGFGVSLYEGRLNGVEEPNPKSAS